jgi:hypothetical protein
VAPSLPLGARAIAILVLLLFALIQLFGVEASSDSLQLGGVDDFSSPRHKS